ncbi:hypothetical protein ACRN9C_20735 [Shewanella frigidimarina]|uniref:hypothetical protein n=1 Tax=Shewanella frigidimarina TaxID=56812 RepID=UPI003D79821A
MVLIIDDSSFNVIRDGEFVGFSPLYKELNIRFSPVGNLSYDLGEQNLNLMEALENTKQNWMMLIPYQQQVFTLDSVKEQLKLDGKDKEYAVFLNNEKYELYFFTNPFDPRVWYGFFALSQGDDVSSSRINLDCMYVRNEYCEDIRGDIMAYEIGTRISDVLKTIINYCIDREFDVKLDFGGGVPEKYMPTINDSLNKGLLDELEAL